MKMKTPAWGRVERFRDKLNEIERWLGGTWQVGTPDLKLLEDEYELPVFDSRGKFIIRGHVDVALLAYEDTVAQDVVDGLRRAADDLQKIIDERQPRRKLRKSRKGKTAKMKIVGAA